VIQSKGSPQTYHPTTAHLHNLKMHATKKRVFRYSSIDVTRFATKIPILLKLSSNTTCRRHIGWDKTFNHSDGKHVRQGVVGAIHTNTSEGFWLLIERGVVGTFHKVSKSAGICASPSSSSAIINPHNADTFGSAIEDAEAI
jgi:hypothetical protein